MADTWGALEAENPGLVGARDKESLAWAGVAGAAPWPDDEEIARSGDCKNPLPRRMADGRLIGGLYAPPTCTIILTQDDAQHRWPMPVGWTTKDIHVAPSGKVALIGAEYDGRGIFAELDLTTGALALVDAGSVDGLAKSDVAQIWDMEYVVDDDHLAVLIGSGKDGYLALYLRTADGWRETDNTKTEGFFLRSTGSVVVVARQKDCMAFAVAGHQLATLGKLDKQVVFVTPAETREVLWGHAGQGKEPHVLVGIAAAAKKKVKKPAKGTTVATRFPTVHAPVHATAAEMAQRFGERWQAEQLRPMGRSAAGSVVASPPGSRLIVGHPDGVRIEVDNPSSHGVQSMHPTEERALLVSYLEGTVAVLDLQSGVISSPIARETARAQYVPVSDGVLVAMQAKGGDTMNFRREPSDGALGEVLCSVQLEGGNAWIAGSDMIIVRAGKTPYNGDIERWSVRADGAKVTCTKETKLVLPGKRYEGENVMAATIAGVGVVATTRNLKSVFPVR